MQQNHSENVKQVEKKPYTAPKLSRHGKVEEMTQGLDQGASCPLHLIDVK